MQHFADGCGGIPAMDGKTLRRSYDRAEQRQVAQQVIGPGGDYALAWQGNSGPLRDDVLLDDPAAPMTLDTLIGNGHCAVRRELGLVAAAGAEPGPEPGPVEREQRHPCKAK